jgi:SET domain-containing protein
MSKSLPFEIRDSGIAGKGAFAIRAIRKGERLIEYTGERISHALADERYDDESMAVHHTFLFHVSRRTVIDASVGGNEARYINHSCAPNCEAVLERGRIWIYALRNIKPGEELHYDYRYDRTGNETEREEQLYRCLCGTPRCRGSILEPIRTRHKRPRPRRTSAKQKESGRRRGEQR